MRKLFLGFVLLLLCFQLASAYDTNIKIKTVPYMNVNVMVLSASYDVLERFNADADKYGDVEFLFSSDRTNFRVTIFVKDLSDNSKVASEKLEDWVAGEDIYLEVIPKGFNIIETPKPENLSATVENLTENASLNDTNQLITIEEKSDKKSFLSGLVIFGENTQLKKIILYSLGGVILVLIIFFVIRKIRKKGTGGEIRVKKLSEWREEQKEDNPENYYGILEETQRKLQETQRELNQIKNQERIKETERKLQQDQEELRRLRGF